MKKILWISGIAAVVLLPLILTGMADADVAVKNTLRQGNTHYASAGYEEALKAYEAGLAINPDNRELNFNAAQAAYMLGDYEGAIEYYGKSDDSIEKFLNLGNACFKLGDAGADESQKMQFYAQALQAYQEGIIQYPQDLPLKYNYETLKEKIEEQMQQSDQNQENGDGEEGEDQESQNQESGEEQNQESQEQNSDNEQESQEQNSENEQESQEQNAGEDENTGQEQTDTQEGEDEQQEAAGQEEAEEDQKEANSQEEGESEQDREAVERILRMLEGQEEESLKNNQEVVGGKGEKYGW